MSTEKLSSKKKYLYAGDQLRLLYPHPWAGQVVKILFMQGCPTQIRVQCIDAPNNECFIMKGRDNFKRVEVPHVL